MDTQRIRDALRNGLGLVGIFELEVRGPDGQVKDRRVVRNLIPSAGLAYLAGILSADESTIPTYLGIGTGTTAAAAGDTALETEVGTRQDGTQSRVTTTVTNDTSQVVGTFGAANPAGGGAITEAGLLTAVSSGTLISRAVFAAVNKAADDSLQITHKIVQANAA